MISHWTEEETEYLFSNCGIIPNKKIAQKLGRTHKAVRQKLFKNSISVFDNFYSARLLAKELGVCHETIMKWYHKGWLKGKCAKWGRGYLNSPMIFTEYGILQFLQSHSRLFAEREIPNLYFRNVISDKE